MNLDEQIQAVKAALTEAGYPHVNVWWDNGYGSLALSATEIPLAIQWMAFAVVTKLACWSCFLESSVLDNFTIGRDCLAGNCHNPDGPHRPPRELLQRSSV